MSDFFHLKSIAQLHRLFGMGKPLHPLITIVRQWPEIDFDFENIKMTSDLYVLGMKGSISGTFKYGRNRYDFEEGTMVFIAPNQVATFDNADSQDDSSGWTIFFHPDLIRKSGLGTLIHNCSFFNYELHEALHISDKEQKTLSNLIESIETELSQNMDKHSQDLILVNLESIIKYCGRFYDRQFYTRTDINKDHIIRFEKFLTEYFASDDLSEKGIPNLTECGKSLNMSGSYLSDLLKLETGRSAKDHIHSFIIQKAKTRLLQSNSTIGEIAYSLGFEYAQHFSKLFKGKVGSSPTEFRNLN